MLEKLIKNYKNIKIAKAIGGKEYYGKVPIGHAIVGTAGKVFNLIKFARKNHPFFDVSYVKYFVIDEADDILENSQQNKQQIEKIYKII